MTLTTEELRKLMEDATQGPWDVDSDGDVVTSRGYMIANMLVLDGQPSSQDTANARLVAAAPDLAKDRIRLEAENAELRAEVEKLRNDDYSPFGGELLHDRVERVWETARVALGEGGE